MLMFGKTLTESTIDIPEFQGHVEPTLEGALEIVYESSREMAEYNASLYIADVLAEQSVMEGASFEVVVEGVVKDSFNKLKEVFKNMWAKVKSWFANAKKLYKQLTLKGKDFIKEFRSELLEKARKAKGKGFQYKGYNYTPEAAEARVNKATAVFMKHISISSDSMETVASQLASASDAAEVGKEYDAAEEIEEMWKAVGFDNVSELNKAILEEARNGADEKEMLEDFEGNSVEELITFVEHGADAIKAAEKLEKDLDKGFTRILKALQGAEAKATQLEGKAEGEEAKKAAAVTALVSHRSKVSKQAISAMMSVAGVQSAYVREVVSASTSALRALLSFRIKGEKSGVKESFGEESILGAAMKSVF